jgi:ribulose-phosphate 3-epimerase
VSIRLAPSILSANFAALGEDIAKVRTGRSASAPCGCDGWALCTEHYNRAGSGEINPKSTNLPLDVHLMISDPDQYIPAFVEAGANILTVHAEATVHLDRTLNFIRSHKVGVGVSINPATPLSAVEHALGLADMLLIMSVNPGFGGQKFIPYTLEKIRKARQIIEERNYRCVIEVDGGIDLDTLPGVVKSGADVLGRRVFPPGPRAQAQGDAGNGAPLSYHSKYV